jgi:hypothetical protein
MCANVGQAHYDRLGADAAVLASRSEPQLSQETAAAAAAAAPSPPLVDLDLFRAGDGGYACFRLPNLVQLRAPGHMLAIVQGHKFDCSDGGRMDILQRRTVDNGKTWTPAEFVYGESTADQNVTMGTPAAVVDLVGDPASGVAPGTIFLFICRNFKHVLLLSSHDGGTSCKPQRYTLPASSTYRRVLSTACTRPRTCVILTILWYLVV